MQVVLEDRATEKGTYVLDIDFRDENGVLVVPVTALWSLTNGIGTVVNARNNVSFTPMASQKTLVLFGLDLAILVGETTLGVRRLTIKATYDSPLGFNLPLNQEFVFFVDNLVNVT